MIAPWAVAAVPLNTAEAGDLLCRCVNRETIAAGVVDAGENWLTGLSTDQLEELVHATA